jgi:hypothetical protein
MLLFAILGLPLMLFFAAVFNGYALSILWGWFVVPTFGVPALTVVQAHGGHLLDPSTGRLPETRAHLQTGDDSQRR